MLQMNSLCKWIRAISNNIIIRLISLVLNSCLAFFHFSKTTLLQSGENQFDSNNFTVLNVLFPKCMAHKKESYVYFSTSPYIHSFPCGMWELDQITTCVFFTSTSSILVHLQTVASGGTCKFYWLPPVIWSLEPITSNKGKMVFKNHINLINIVVMTGETGKLGDVEEMQCKYQHCSL